MPTPTSPSQESASEVVHPTQAPSSRPEERRRFPRLALSREAFRLKPHGKLFAISDLSPQGFCLRLTEEQDLAAFPLGSTFQGELGFRGERIRVQAIVRHLERGFVGAEMVEISPQARAILDERLTPHVLGGELKLIPGGDFSQLWYHALNGADWNLQLGAQDQVDSFLVRLHGIYVQWRRGKEGASDFLSSGSLGYSLPMDFDSGAVRMETWVLHPDPLPQEAKLRIAIQLLSGCNEKPELKGFCLAQMRPQ